MLVAGWSGVAMAQVNCETIRPGPERTDCSIGVGRINREKSAIAAGVAQPIGKMLRNERRAHTVSA